MGPSMAWKKLRLVKFPCGHEVPFLALNQERFIGKNMGHGFQDQDKQSRCDHLFDKTDSQQEKP